MSASGTSAIPGPQWPEVGPGSGGLQRSEAAGRTLVDVARLADDRAWEASAVRANTPETLDPRQPIAQLDAVPGRAAAAAPAAPAFLRVTPSTVQRTTATPLPVVPAGAPVGAAHGLAGDPQGADTGPAIQRAAVPQSAPFAITGAPAVQRAETTAPAAEPTPAGKSDRELDELARSLFGRIRGQLRSELINEREAKGLTFDSA
jgi:hypothetical protein